MKGSARLVTASFALGLAAACAFFRPDRAALVAFGLVSQTLCSASFVSGPDAFYASGHLHQKVLIVPSRRLVTARFGATHAPDDGFGSLADEVLGTLQEVS